MVLFLGDTHGHFRHVIDAVNQHAPDAIVFLGDVQARAPLEKELAPILDQTEVFFIHGNHDTDTEADYDNLFGSQLGAQNLHGRVVDVAGLRMAGLGGVFRSKIWMPPEAPVFSCKADYLAQAGKGNRWRGGLPLRHRSTLFEEDFLALAVQTADILVTHEAPSCHPSGFEVFDDLGRAMQIQKFFHGHHHDFLDYSGARTRMGFSAWGVGFCGIVDENGNVIRAGDQDESRRGRQALVRGAE